MTIGLHFSKANHSKGIKDIFQIAIIRPHFIRDAFFCLNMQWFRQIGDRPGVTRNSQWVRISPYLDLLDTPGLLWPRLDDQLSARRLCYIGSIKDDVVDLTDLTVHLLEDLCEMIPERIEERFHIQDPTLKGENLLNAVCSGRGWLLKGGRYDYDRCCRVVLDEFRGGKLGRITLEEPPAEQLKETGTDD